MNLNKVFLSFFVIVIAGYWTLAWGQSYEIGEWVEHVSKRSVQFVDENNGVIYAATKSAVYLYDVESGEFTTKTTVEGLSGVSISAIKYNKEYDFLMVGYASGLIDFVYDDNVYTIVDVQQNSSLNSKTINNIHFAGDTAFLACDFGLILLNIPNKEIKSTFFLGTSQQAILVNDVALGFDSIWVATDNGVYAASQFEDNLHNYQNWKLVDRLPNNNDGYTKIELIGNELYCVATSSEASQDFVYKYSHGAYEQFWPGGAFRVRSLEQRGDFYTLIVSYNLFIFDHNGELVKSLYYNGYQSDWGFQQDAVYYNGDLYYANQSWGIIKVNEESEIAIYPNAPFSNTINQLVFNNERLYVASGIRGAKLNNYGIQIYDDYWLNLNKYSNPNLGSVPNFNYIAFENGNDSKMYATSYGYGFTVFNDTSLVEFYNEANSTLQNYLGYPVIYILTSGLVADNETGAWVAVDGVPNPLNYYNGSGEWSSFNLNGEISNNVIRDMIKTQWNHIWMAVEGKGVAVFDPEKLKSNQISDGYNLFSVKSSDGSSLTSTLTTLAVDHDGYVWFGMNEGGLGVFYNASSAVENDITASRIIVEQGGIAQYLLENEKVSCIAIDAGNRKWIGTETGGAFLISADGTEQIFNLNTKNSPLPTNIIKDIALDEENGLVYIGTEEGLFAFYTGVKESSSVVDELKIYPNPVYENYNDLVRIEGLQDEMKLKITDVAGQLVFETKATGGTAYWNMKDFYNNRVSTGVYMFYASSQDGSQLASGRIFVVSQ